MNPDDLQAEYERLKAQAAQLEAENTRLRGQVQEYEQRLTEAREQIAELQRQLFGPKADRLTPEQQEQVNQLTRDLEAEAARPDAASDSVLAEEEPKSKDKRRRARGVRHPLPIHLETETVVLEPELTRCNCCGEMPYRIGEEVTEEVDMVPAKLVRRRTVRPKYACGCGDAGVAIALLPSRLIPQSKLGLGLAVYITLARFDDHLSFYRLEQQFHERHGVAIPRQQMVQWVEKIAFWLQPIYNAMWAAMLPGGYYRSTKLQSKCWTRK
jgi:transposase